MNPVTWIASRRTSLTVRLSSYDGAHSARAIDAASILTLAYLALPNFIFFLGWLRWPFALLMSSALLWSIFKAIDWRLVTWRLPCDRWVLLAAVTTAFVWCAFGGAGHFGAANIDWEVRDAVLGDLAYGDWPVSYREQDGVHYILRSAIGYFLPAAVVAKAVGIHWADVALYLWTVIGTALFLLVLPLPTRYSRRFPQLLLLVVMFSGMDLLGVLSHQGQWPEFPGRIEWWVPFSYSSLSGQLFWAPNHALPIWLASALFYRHWRHPAFLPFVCVLASLLPIWTPFALPGLAPFFLLAALWWRRSAWSGLPSAVWINTLVLIALVGRFLTLDIDTIAIATSVPKLGHEASPVLNYLSFSLFEFAALAVVVGARLKHSHGILCTAVAVLALLPLLAFGPSNDLLLRASIPALILLMILTLGVFQSEAGPTQVEETPWLIVIFLLIGALTPFYEAGRAATLKRWLPNYQRTLVDQQGGHMPAHYVGRLDRRELRLLLRDPVIVPSARQRPITHPPTPSRSALRSKEVP